MITGPITQSPEPCDVCSGAGCLICSATAGEHQGPCDPCPKCFAKDADFASLVSTEPQEPIVARYCGAAAPGEYGGPDEPCGVTLPCPHHGILVAAERRGDSPGSGRSQAMDAAGAASDYVAVMAARRERDLAQKTQASMAARIQALEGVLGEIRAKALEHPTTPNLSAEGWAAFVHKKVGDINTIIGETLDPHQPWCRDESHEGACISDPEERDDGE